MSWAGRNITRLCGAFVVVIAVLALAGAALDIEQLASLHPSLPTTKVSSATGFLILGALLAWQPARGRAAGRRIAAAGFVCVLGLLSLIDATLESDVLGSVGFGTWSPGAPYSGVMADATALGLVAAGLGVAAASASPRRERLAQGGALVAVLLGVFAVIGYAYGIEQFRGIAGHTQMALNSGAAVLALGIGVLFIDPPMSLAQIVRSESAGGAMLRRVLPLMLVTPVLYGEVVLLAERRGYWDSDFSTGLMAVGIMTVLGAIMVWSARLLDQHEQEVVRGRSLAEANELKSQFVATAAHELRTPLVAISGFLELLQTHGEALGPERSREYLTTIDRQVRQLIEMVRRLLAISKIEAGVIDVAADELDVREAVARVLEELDLDAVEVSCAAGLTVFADAQHLRQMLTNYLSNAYRYGMPPVRVVCRNEGAAVAIRVCDRGTGVPAGGEELLFGKFVQLSTPNDGSEGTGLGLAITRALARANDGDAWYERDPVDGTCFAVRLPRTGPVTGTGGAAAQGAARLSD